MKNKHIFGWLIAISMWLTGCSLITPTVSPAIDIYTISPEMSQAKALSEKGVIKVPSAVKLALSSIRSPQALMTTDIIYRDKDYGFNRYAYNRWSDSPSKLLEDYLQQYLADSQYILAVIPVGSRTDSDLLLEATLVDFSHHLAANGFSAMGVVTINCYLLNSDDRSLIATKQFTKQVTLEQNDAKGAVKALNQASQAMAERLQAWLEHEIINKDEK